MADNVKFISFNTQGLNNKKKRNAILRNLKRENFTVVAIQESHLTERDIEIMNKEWGGIIHASHGTNRSKGLITLFNKSISPDNIKLLATTDRTIISSLQFNSQKYFIVNL